MLTISEDAAGFLIAVLEDAQASRETAVRLTRKGDGFASSLDTVRPGDVTIAHSGRKVLLMDAGTSIVLDNRSLELQATEDRLRLRIN